MNVEEQVAAYYTRRALEQKILFALEKAGKDIGRVTAEDLGPLDNFHLGGRQSTEQLAGVMGICPGMHLLDVGCGMGGPARYFAERGCQVTGLDLSEEFVSVAESLTRLLKLDGKLRFQQGSALEMPFPAGTFDGAYMIHVGMNLENKGGGFREVRRVLKPGGKFAIFDIMRNGNAALDFPMPWAVTPQTSFVSPVDEYRRALEAAGFRVEHERNRHQFAVEFMQKIAALPAPPILGVHVLMGEQAPLMLRNVNSAIADGRLDPVELVGVVQ